MGQNPASDDKTIILRDKTVNIKKKRIKRKTGPMLKRMMERKWRHGLLIPSQPPNIISFLLTCISYFSQWLFCIRTYLKRHFCFFLFLPFLPYYYLIEHYLDSTITVYCHCLGKHCLPINRWWWEGEGYDGDKMHHVFLICIDRCDWMSG